MRYIIVARHTDKSSPSQAFVVQFGAAAEDQAGLTLAA